MQGGFFNRASSSHKKLAHGLELRNLEALRRRQDEDGDSNCIFSSRTTLQTPSRLIDNPGAESRSTADWDLKNVRAGSTLELKLRIGMKLCKYLPLLNDSEGIQI